MADETNDPQGTSAEAMFSEMLAESPEIQRVVDEFICTLPVRLTAIQEALRDDSYDQVASLAHQLQVSGHASGCPSVSEQAGDIERAAHDHAIDALTDKLAEMKALIEQLRGHLPHTD